MIKRAMIVASMMTVASGGLSADDKGGRICLAEALYYEARDQGWRGMLAVGTVIQNRVKDPRYPDDACGVVRQGKYRNGKPVKHKCQFSYYCDGKPERPAEKEAWRQAVDIATLLTTTAVEIAGLEGATHYHASWVQPSWSKGLERRKQIGGHIFYARKD
jgi:spore germination cell wall hydrolase CwlJ-like protein|tara:strand:- start:278 stop:757 length:480 start_codon:yes stop_codon:yes gene_type:complete